MCIEQYQTPLYVGSRMRWQTVFPLSTAATILHVRVYDTQYNPIHLFFSVQNVCFSFRLFCKTISSIFAQKQTELFRCVFHPLFPFLFPFRQAIRDISGREKPFS